MTARPHPSWAAGLAGVVLLAGCGGSGEGGPSAAAPRASPKAVPVGTAVVAARPIVYSVRGIGSLEAYQVVTVSARVEGAIEHVAFEEGDAVGTDRVLGVVDGERRALLVTQAETSVTRLAAAIVRTKALEAAARANLAEARANLDRREKMRRTSPGIVSDEEYAGFQAQVARTEAALDVAQAATGEADAAVVEEKAKLAVARREKADADVRAPIAGVVERKHVAEGQHLKEGDAVATIVDAHVLRLRFRVTAADSVRLHEGATATFRTTAMPGRAFSAKVVHVDAAADAATRMVECVADVVDRDPALKPGFFADVSVETGGDKPSVVVPEDAVLPSEQGWVAFVVEGGVARKRAPSLGLHTPDGGVEVLSGLSAGEALVVRGAAALEDGVAVAPESIPAPGAPPPAPGAVTPAPTGGGAR